MNISPNSVGQLAQERQILAIGGQIPEVRQHRLDDDAGQLVRVLAQNPLRRLDVIVMQVDNVLDHAGRLARPLGDTRRLYRVERVERRINAHRDVLMVPVVSTLDLGDLVLACECAGGADRVQRSLGARVRKSHLLDRRHPLAKGPRQPDLRLVRSAVAEAVRRLLAHRLDDPVVRVTEHVGCCVEHEIEVAVPVHVDDVVSFRALDEERVGPKVRRAARASTRQVSLRLDLKLRRPRRRCRVSFSFRVHAAPLVYSA